jgi:hypothetical protein
MKRSWAAAVGVALAAMAVLWFVLGTSTPRGVGHEGDDEGPHKPIAQPVHGAELQITLGLKDTEQVTWKGQVSVSEGHVLAVEIERASRASTAEGTRFSVSAARQATAAKKAKKKKAAEEMPLAPARLRVMLDAPPQATVKVETSQGDFSFALAELQPKTAKTFLDGQASVQGEEGAVRLTPRETEDDFPVVAKGPGGAVWLAYVEYTPGPPVNMERIQSAGFDVLVPKGHGDRIRLMHFHNDAWQRMPDATDGGQDVWRPTITVDGKGVVWVMWAQNVDGDWEIFSRRFTPPTGAAKGAWSAIERVTKSPGSDFHTVSCTDSTDKVWLAWQAWRNGNYEILLASAGSDGKWSEPKTISTSKANDWSPAIAADSKGRVYVAWDSYDRDNYDVQLHVAGPQTKTISVADSPRFEARPSLYCDASDRLWIAYEEGDEQWGKDYASSDGFRKVGLEKNPGFALYVNRTVKVKCLVDGTLKQPAGELEAGFGKTLTRGKSVPRLAGDAAGGVWLLVRHHPLAAGGGETWHSYALRYNGREWSAPRHLTNSSNLLDNRPALAAVGNGLLVVYSGDDRERTQDRDQDDLFSAILTTPDETFDVELADNQPAPAATVATVHPNEAENIARLRAQRVTVGDKELRLLRGEFHRHTEYTAHRDQDGLLEDAWRYALDASNMDWMGDGDHDNGFGHEYMWWQVQKITDLHQNPPSFVSVMSYERSNTYPNGHRNVIMPVRGIRPLPRGNLQGTPETGTPDTKLLYNYLKHFGGMCASHTSGTNMGTDWRDNDPDVEPVVEIYQGHRHNYEHFGAPRSPTAETQIGGYQPPGFVWNALEKGYVLGFQSSSDHVSTHMSYAIVLAEDTSRQAIIDAFKQRHCYAATDNVLLIVRSGEHLMGDKFKTDQRPKLTIQAYGTTPIAKLHVVRDNKYIYTVEPKTREVQREFTDMDAQPGKTSYYYVRVEQDDGNLAWASPMWITYEP